MMYEQQFTASEKCLRNGMQSPNEKSSHKIWTKG